MRNAEKFKKTFGLYATELWAKSQKEFLEWLNTPYIDIDTDNFINILYLDNTQDNKIPKFKYKNI